MDFLTKMIETEDTFNMAALKILPMERRVRSYYQIPVGDCWLSIQASVYHYCTPRENLENLAEYTTMEFALLNRKAKFISVTDVLPGFTELEDYYDGTIYSYAPVELIEKLYQALKGSNI